VHLKRAVIYGLLLAIGFAAFQLRSSVTATQTAAAAPPVTITIPLAALDDIRSLDHRPEVAEVMRTARTYSDSPIFVEAYVTADDATSTRAGAVAAELVIEMGGYLATHGVEPDRITGQGMGIDPTIGRAVVVSFGKTLPAPALDPRIVEAARQDPGRAPRA
jgi:hypothetical protein